ncbi:MAG TPA: phenylalanine--tRNA ligase subunit beta, partial [Flavobacteriaceae bacterium]|nr:phenylalanine--tRNA ligase subunit beta [Flavobacteriaceae bacterium]
GVFGGIESGVSENTENIFLESAYFNPISIRKTAKRHALNTDASFRFERGIDPNLTEYALIHAALLIREIAGGKITSDVMDIYPKKIQDHQVFLNFNNATSLIGEEIPKEIIKEILTSLDIKINNVTEAGLGMTIPAYRNDVTREADVIEEILRVYGYNNIKFTEKLNASIAANQLIEDYQIQNKIGNQLTALGFYEMMGNSLTSPKYIDLSKALSHENNIKMLNPLSNDLSVMRQSMLFNALEALSFNSNRKISDLKLFEFGKTYHQFDTALKEPKHLSLLVSGLKGDTNWISPSSKSTFFYFKGFVTNVLDRLGITDYSENGTKDENFSEGLSFSKNNKLLVEFGTINKSITAAFGIDAETFYADFKWDEVLEEIATDNFKLKAISKFPKVKRDLALLIDESITFDSLKKTAQKTEKKLLKNINLFDVYTGSKLPEGKKSYALSFTIQDEKRTLTDKQIDKIMKKLQQNFESEFGASLR